VGRPRVPEVVWNVLCRLSSQKERAGGSELRRRLRMKSRLYLYLSTDSPFPENRIRAQGRPRAQSTQWQTCLEVAHRPCRAVRSKPEERRRGWSARVEAKETVRSDLTSGT
jgi:hypothetical protein